MNKPGLFALLLVCCVDQPPAGAARAKRAPAPASTPGVASSQAGVVAPAVLASGRLPAGPRPLRYRLDLSVDPAKPGFSGYAQIELRATTDSHFVVLHGQDLIADEIWLEQAGARIAASLAVRAAASQAPDEWVVALSAPMRAATAATLHVRYHATYSADLSGVYRVTEPAGAYVFTQFEATDARRAFPCFYEPSFKTPYQLTLRVPAT
jgi:cytosol alanyl aminopeptidase